MTLQSKRAISIFGIVLLYAATFFYLYTRLYGVPDMYQSDNLMGEDIYLDLFVKNRPWALWGLPGAAQYVETAMYFLLRAVSGNLDNAMAAHGALVAVMVAASAAWAVIPALPTEKAKLLAWVFSPLLAFVYPFAFADFYLTTKLAHGQTVSAAFFGLGIFLRYIQRPFSRTTLLLVTLFLLSMVASDKLFILWMLIPAGIFTLLLLWKAELPFLRGIGWLCITGLSLLLGKALNLWIRNYPTHYNPFDPGFSRFFTSLWSMLLSYFQWTTESWWVVCWFVLGMWGLVRALRSPHKPARHCGTLFLLASMLTFCGVAVSGVASPSYAFMGMYLFFSIGLLLLATPVAQFMGNRVPLLAMATALGIAALLWVKLPQKLPPYYPELVRAVDAIAKEKGLTAGVAGHWEARMISILSKEGVECAPLEGRGIRYVTFNYSRALIKDNYQLFVARDEPLFENVDRDMEIRANGQPDNIIHVPGPFPGWVHPTSGFTILVYENGAHHPTEGEVMLNGKQLLPDWAKGDQVHWQGSHTLSNGITLQEVRTVTRPKRHMALLLFKEPLQDIQGKTLVIEAVGDKAPKHKWSMAQRMSTGGNEWLDSLYALFLPSRELKITTENSEALPGGGSFAWVAMPNWNSKEWRVLFVTDDKERLRIK